MSISQKEFIDLIGIDKRTGAVHLTISDHLDWEDVDYHLQELQDKINAYIAFIEGGQILKEYPKSEGKELVIEIISKYDYPTEGEEFLDKARPIVASIGAELRQRTSKETD